MTQHDNAPELLRRASARLAVDEPDLDLDSIMRQGYRERRRRHAALAGAAGAGVAAVAAVLALSLAGPPRTEDPGPTGKDPDPSEVEDPVTSGYPYAAEGFGTASELAQLDDAAAAAFGQLLADTGVLADGEEPAFAFDPVQSPGNYGQTWLRSFVSEIRPEDGETPDDAVLRVEALLPGGWTAEPGPATEQVFPQHLISASGSPWYEDADWTDELVTTELDDGRVVHAVDHECAYEVGVAYPNGTGLLVSWDMGCHGPSPEYSIPMEDFTAAVESMPQFEFDTTELAPVGDLVEVPTGWTWDPAWGSGGESGLAAADTMDAARSALNALHPEAVLDEGESMQLGANEYGAFATRVYAATAEIPLPDGDIGFDLTYYLPGGWIPGIGEPGERGLYPVACGSGYTCTQETDDDGTTWAFAVGPTATGETAHLLDIVRFAPDGWAVGISASADTPIDTDTLTDLMRSLPAPVYDTEAVPTIPTD
ncbi:hypothetical protein SAMN05216298_0435 [Glycomyces sambucus]|uniref:Uncharacterized protein n=1 Tax=Glycomyces sambucus TaxID=380244 RepID=A0A1G9CNK5_9ACTN|nr:hypothetical protein [Glycomyces sambucus]SDK53217.1 hypothetical protein SAMN05216298_0435 [Glycomyces sambucus]